jgi:hypothetical protein
MNILTVAFILIALVAVATSWIHLRANWRSIQSMRSKSKGPIEPLGVDGAYGADSAAHGPHCHESAHHGTDDGGHHSGFDVGDHGGFDGGHGGFDGGGGHH